VIGIFSVLAAYLFWAIGDSVGRVVSSKAVVGASFQLGGVIAGFVFVFRCSGCGSSPTLILSAFARVIERSKT
jgi:cytochrome c biogenesis protein CcdA